MSNNRSLVGTELYFKYYDCLFFLTHYTDLLLIYLYRIIFQVLGLVGFFCLLILVIYSAYTQSFGRIGPMDDCAE